MTLPNYIDRLRNAPAVRSDLLDVATRLSGPLPSADAPPGYIRRQTFIDSYRERGFRLVFYDRGSKHPRGKRATDWPIPGSDASSYQPGDNVGVMLGEAIQPGKFLADIDFDWADGVPLFKKLLPDTDFVFGRAGSPVSHAFYTTPAPLECRQFEDVAPAPGDKPTLVELRGCNVGGTIGHQTMLPPSVHPNGEVLEMRIDGPIAHVPDLLQRVTDYAIACLLYKHLGKRGFGHNTMLAFCAFLLRQEVSEKRIRAIGEAVATATGNDVKDVAECLGDTKEKFDAPERKRVTSDATFAKAFPEHGKKILARIKEWLGGRGSEEIPPDAIVMRGGGVTTIVDRVVAALLDEGTPIYQRGGALVRPVRLDRRTGDTSADAVRREAGTTMLAAVREHWLLEQMGLVASWFREGKRIQRADPDPRYARTLLGRGEWRFPVLRSVLTAPTLNRDGRIVERPGFDEASGFLLDFPVGGFPPVPSAPTKDDARAALALLAAPLRAFPFVDDAAKSVALSALLTALVRASLRTAPLHGFDAPTAGTGKSLLAEMAGLLATGARPPALSQGRTDEEDQKRLSTVLFAGDPVIHIDNCERFVSGDFLCSMLTQEVVQARILGQSERRVLPCTALVLASGNNLTFSGDTSRRAVVCRLDANEERPDTRTFDFDCHAEVMAARPELVVAGLTVLRAYVVAGRPVKLTPMGSFADWEWVRGALVWLGCADPADTRAAILDNDPRKDELTSVMDLWQKAVGEKRIEVGEIAKRAEPSGDADFDAVHAAPAWQELRDRLAEATSRGSGRHAWNAKSVGWWLRRHKDRVVGGKCFRCEAGKDGQQWWLVVPRKDGGLFDDCGDGSM